MKQHEIRSGIDSYILLGMAFETASSEASIWFALLSYWLDIQYHHIEGIFVLINYIKFQIKTGLYPALLYTC